ncbi:MAG: hypothetical protein LBQ54_02625 [Planctomycetaceae bacterium]|jgi:hypothetical protein|nr:hypothetical protein [Planctomycetaceae bacterium]
MKYSKTLLTLLIGTSIILLVSGCGSRYPKTVRVNAHVTLDGKPFPNVQVFLIPTNGERGALGISDREGYVAAFSTFQPNDGAVPGTHKVSVLPKLPPPMPGTTSTPEQIALEKEMRENPDNITPPFPAKYQVSETSGITVTVDSKTEEFTIEMTSK